MTNQPDPAAVRCEREVEANAYSAEEAQEIITKTCALPQGRALAEAVLAGTPTGKFGMELQILAQSYLDQLDGKT